MSTLASRRMSADGPGDITERPPDIAERTGVTNPAPFGVIPCHDPIATGVLPPATG